MVTEKRVGGAEGAPADGRGRQQALWSNQLRCAVEEI